MEERTKMVFDTCQPTAWLETALTTFLCILHKQQHLVDWLEQWKECSFKTIKIFGVLVCIHIQ